MISSLKNHSKKIQILGTRGIPAAHGGFETFAEGFSIYLTARGWDVTVYCQEDGAGTVYEDDWQGVHRVHIPVRQQGAKGTIVFDWISTLQAVKRNIPVLTLGYNTAVFCLLYRLKGIKNIINMDGIEWQRDKWSLAERTWLYLNEKAGAWLGNHLIADHPEIKNHLTRFVAEEKITVIPYSAHLLQSADPTQLEPFGLTKDRYAILIARPEPENSILEIIRAYSEKKRGLPLVVLGNYDPQTSAYQKSVLDAASDEIMFVGAIYEPTKVQALRFFARFYIHGHTVGGTNPSLVEALGAGSPVLAHDNRFNRWVAGKNSLYFSTESECARKIEDMIKDDHLIARMKTGSQSQYKARFTSQKIHGDYEQILTEMTH